MFAVDVEPREDLSSAEKIKKSTHHSETTMDELKMVRNYCKNLINIS
jgi:hypothetical protein